MAEVSKTSPIQQTPTPTAPNTGLAAATPSGAPQPDSNQDQAKAYMSDLINRTKQIFPETPAKTLALHLPNALKGLATLGLTSRNQCIGFLATVYVETVGFVYLEEIASGADYEGRSDLGNTNPGDGVRFKGRGYIQITGRTNYTAIAKKFGIDCVSKPELMSSNLDLCGKGSAWWWAGNTGNNPARYAEQANWGEVRRQVNGGTNGMGKFMAAIERAQRAWINEPLNTALLGAVPLDGSYGLNCVDAGSSGGRSVGGNPLSQGDAIARALGLHLLDRQMAIKFDGWIHPGALPEVLKLRAQSKFIGANFGEGLDGELTVDEIRFYCGKNPRVHIVAYQPDPNVPNPIVFRHDAASPDTPPSPANLNQANVSLPEGTLPVPYFSQRKNKHLPDATCNSSSCAMAVAYLTGKLANADEYVEKIFKFPGRNPSIDHGNQIAVMAQYGVKGTLRSDMDFADLDKELGMKKPIALGILHRGSDAAPDPNKSHITVCIGKTQNGDYIFNDPYGNLMDGYSNDQGAGVIYPRATLQKRWLDRGARTGQGMIFRT